jgi:hypothetical protein
MEETAQSEMFSGFFDEKVRDHRRNARARYKELMDEHGPLLPQSALSVWLDISRARVSQLVLDGTLPRFEIGGHNYIPMVAVEFYRTAERKAGRPIREKTLGDNVSAVWKSFKNRRK